jgi:hypothetical protein
MIGKGITFLILIMLAAEATVASAQAPMRPTRMAAPVNKNGLPGSGESSRVPAAKAATGTEQAGGRQSTSHRPPPTKDRPARR